MNNKKNNIISNQINNNSLPNASQYKQNIKQNNIKKYIINNEEKNSLKSQIIQNKHFNSLQMKNLDNKDYKSSMTKIFQKHINDSKKEEFEKQKIDEVKFLLNKIVSDFEV